jgi:hypothetical protein
MTTYRNDHEAAIARVESLEREVAKLRTNTPTVRVTRKPWPLFAASLAAMTAGVIGGVALVASAGRPAKSQAMRIEHSQLVECASSIEPRPMIDRGLGPKHMVREAIIPLPLHWHRAATSSTR